ncbi:MAG: transporter substrate-binding domain-containing protein [Marinobacter sp.]|uniref:substrate-binding periplasmic protein n=1 Tax=Marinobacter sp. TaxID=50741 RepID=UPI00299E7E29|nr:transporter substrate-binding domain-containing protein [Marinobacter sp.]MDX1635185.1 transporter substrate-binding domain-containing protein [Marinobacter sp.]
MAHGTVSAFFVILLSLLSSSLAAESIVLAAEDDYYPFSAEVDGELVGLVPELASAAYAEVDRDVRFVVGPFPRALMLTETGQVSGGFTGAIDDSNRDDFHWHQTPLTSVRLMIWGRTGNREQGLSAEDMEGKRVSVTRGFFYTDAIDQNDRVKKTVAPSDEASMKMLALGRSDYALVTEQIGRSIVANASSPSLKGKVEAVGLIQEVPVYIFFSKSHPEGGKAARLFQQGLEILIEKGEYRRLLDRWLAPADRS